MDVHVQCIYTHVPVVFSSWASSTESFCRIKVDAGTKFELNLLSSNSSICLVTFTDGGPSTGITYKQGVSTNSSTEPVQIQIADYYYFFLSRTITKTTIPVCTSEYSTRCEKNRYHHSFFYFSFPGLNQTWMSLPKDTMQHHFSVMPQVCNHSFLFCKETFLE